MQPRERRGDTFFLHKLMGTQCQLKSTNNYFLLRLHSIRSFIKHESRQGINYGLKKYRIELNNILSSKIGSCFSILDIDLKTNSKKSFRYKILEAKTCECGV